MDDKMEQFNKDIEKSLQLHDWLLTLKEGMQVAVESYNYGKVSYTIRKVDKIMSTKIIVNSIVFHRKDGKQIRGKGRDMWGTAMEIKPITQYIKDQIAKGQKIAHARYILNNINQNVLNDLTLNEANILCTHLDDIADVITTSIARMKEAQDLLIAEQQARIERLQEGNANLQDQEETEAYHAIINEWQDMKKKNNRS